MFGTMSCSSNTFGQSSNSPFGSPSVFGQNNNANNNQFAQKPFGSPSPFGAQTGGFIFGGTYTGVFGSSPVFGLSSTLAFWSSMPAFVASSSPAFGASSSPAFGGTSAFGQEPAFGGFGLYTIIPAFYIIPASSTPAFGSSPAPAFGAASSPFGIGSSPAFGQSAFGSSPFGTATSAFGASSSPFGGQTTTPAFGSPGFGQSFGQLVGSRITPYAQKPEVDSGIFSGKLESISVMPAYKEKSHEELRWEDYQLGDKGGPNPAGQSSGGMGFGTNNDQQSNLFPSSSAFNQMSSNLFSSTTSTDPFAPKTSTFRTPGFANSTPSLVSSPFVAAMSNPFASTPTPTPSVFGTAPAFASVTSPSLFGTPSTSTFRTTSFGSNQPRGTSFSTSLNFANTQSSPLSQSSTPSLGQTSSPFRQSNFGQPAPAFSAPAFGASSTSAFGTSSTPAFGASSTPAFGASPAPAFGAASSPFGFGSSPAFGQSASAFGSSPFGTATSAFGAPSSPFGGQATTPAFGSPGFGQPSAQRVGSRVTPYAQTPEADSGASGTAVGKLESISAMPAYKEKSHEELRWEDYQSGDKGGPNPAGQSSGFGTNNAQQSNPFSSTSAFNQISSNPFSSTTSTNPFAPKTSTFSTPGFANSTPSLVSSPFGVATSNPFASTPTPTPSVFGTTSAFASATSPSLFGTPSTSTFGTTSIFGTNQAQGTSFSTSLNFANSQSSPLFQSSTPSFQTSSPFGQSNFGQPASAFSAPPFGQSNAFAGNMFSSTPSLNTGSTAFNPTTPSLSMPFQSAQPAQNPGGFGFPAPAAGIGGTTSIFGQNNFGQLSATQGPTIAQQQSITNPFGTLPAMPQMSIGGVGNAPSIQYGISSLPVVDKPAPMRLSSVLTSRHLSQRRVRLPARKYHPKNDGPKVSFFSDEEDTTSTPKADALFIPRENPRALVIRPLEQGSGKPSADKPKNASSPAQANGENSEFASTTHVNGRFADNGNRNHSENGILKEQTTSINMAQKTNGVHDDHSAPKSDSYISLTGHRAGEAAIVYEHGADIEALMPKLRQSDYYTEPRIQELAAKERAQPGFCRRVKDFVVGRHNYGSIKFLGETDVRRLELESLIQFNNREVIVYLDETKKPPIGQGLNKPAEVTLLSIKCFDKKTGRHFTEGPRIEKYKEMLKKKAEDQGAEFVSYDPVKGEWKFRVSHFSRYWFQDDDEDDSA